MPSHYGKHTRREYLRHNPTDWKERAMGGRKKVTIKNNVISRGDPVPTSGKIYPHLSDPARGSGTVSNQAKGTHVSKIEDFRSKNYPFGDKKKTTSGASTGASTKKKWGAGSLLAVPGALAGLKAVDMVTKDKTTKKKTVGRPKDTMLKKVKKKVSNIKSKILRKASNVKKKVTSTTTYKKLEDKKNKLKKTDVGKKIKKVAKVTKKVAKKTPRWTFPTLLGGGALGAAASWYLKD